MAVKQHRKGVIERVLSPVDVEARWLRQHGATVVRELHEHVTSLLPPEMQRHARTPKLLAQLDRTLQTQRKR